MQNDGSGNHTSVWNACQDGPFYIQEHKKGACPGSPLLHVPRFRRSDSKMDISDSKKSPHGYHSPENNSKNNKL
ncbi:hypothetical protein D5274_11030 [bacterium 1XD42-94]|jgi:hypothetical protein|nr:hypothetical protein [bacterium 1XD42-76]NBK05668.1 hypothetical protein [bacterium 1XD42-94]